MVLKERAVTVKKRQTVTIDEDNIEYFHEIKAQKLTTGNGDLSFTSYMNAYLAHKRLTLSEIIELLKKRAGQSKILEAKQRMEEK